ncbi:hypothetical protein BS47DRAFT_1428204 [Hydnum rufescens UP504]|uniref:Uncharacterized protein n=1 Tax=Hydnum rufescens UP504 TaxID=1448309 RepID=A0A9P6DLZ9_9AGAM|nr:hypothetical protein BS47DRAFT_1428204 [Hydnum rufescens UP504]
MLQTYGLQPRKPSSEESDNTSSNIGVTFSHPLTTPPYSQPPAMQQKSRHPALSLHLHDQGNLQPPLRQTRPTCSVRLSSPHHRNLTSPISTQAMPILPLTTSTPSKSSNSMSN